MTTYAYDETGNRTATNADTYTTGDANQTTADGTYSYSYDENGNLVAKYVDADSDGVLDAGDTDITEYTWDVRNRMTEAAHRDLFAGDLDWTAQYDYDVFNHRIASRYDDDGDGIADRVERYVWDGDQIVLEFVDTDGANNSLNEGTSSAPLALATRYVWGQAVDQLLAQETVSNGSPADVSYIVRDNLGSTRSLVSHLGDVTATYSYDSYGNVTATVGSLTATRFLYTCQEYDTRLGLYYYNARWYSPTLGRFISKDPMGFAAGDANLYRYVGNNSTTYTDPSGLCKESNEKSSSRHDANGMPEPPSDPIEVRSDRPLTWPIFGIPKYQTSGGVHSGAGVSGVAGNDVEPVAPRAEPPACHGKDIGFVTPQPRWWENNWRWDELDKGFTPTTVKPRYVEPWVPCGDEPLPADGLGVLPFGYMVYTRRVHWPDGSVTTEVCFVCAIIAGDEWQWADPNCDDEGSGEVQNPHGPEPREPHVPDPIKDGPIRWRDPKDIP